MNKEMVDFLARVLRLPWMDQGVKVAIKASRRDFLLLSHLIDRAVTSEEGKGYIPADSMEGLKAIAADMLSKADLPDDFAQSFKDISVSKKPR
jgi:hypothetical protein